MKNFKIKTRESITTPHKKLANPYTIVTNSNFPMGKASRYSDSTLLLSPETLYQKSPTDTPHKNYNRKRENELTNFHQQTDFNKEKNLSGKSTQYSQKFNQKGKFWMNSRMNNSQDFVKTKSNICDKKANNMNKTFNIGSSKRSHEDLDLITGRSIKKKFIKTEADKKSENLKQSYEMTNELLDEWFYIKRNAKQIAIISSEIHNKYQNASLGDIPKISWERKEDEKKPTQHVQSNFMPIKSKKQRDTSFLNVEINKTILDDQVLTDIKKNGILIMDKNQKDLKAKEKKVKMRLNLNSLDWQDSQFKYYLNEIYQEKCKRFDSQHRLQSRNISKKNSELIALEAKAKKLLAPKINEKIKKNVFRSIQMFRKSYWELTLKIQIKVLILRQQSLIIQGKRKSKFMNNDNPFKKNLMYEASNPSDNGEEKNDNYRQCDEDFHADIEAPNNLNQLLKTNTIAHPIKLNSKSHLESPTALKEELEMYSLMKPKSETQIILDCDTSIEKQLKDFNVMSMKLKQLKSQQKSLKLSLKKMCKDLLLESTILYNQEATTQMIIQQLWEIKQKVSLTMFSDAYDNESKNFYLGTAALQQQYNQERTNQDLFLSMILESNGCQIDKLDSIVDFSSNIEYESFDVLKLAFRDFFCHKGKSNRNIYTSDHKVPIVHESSVMMERKEILRKAMEKLNLKSNNTKDKTAHIWEAILNVAANIIQNNRKSNINEMIEPFQSYEPIVYNNISDFSFLRVYEKKIIKMETQELSRIEVTLTESEFSVEEAFKYYKLVRNIEGRKKAGVRIMRTLNKKINRIFIVEDNVTRKKSQQNDLLKLSELIKNSE